jgi:hypothetical protein
MATNTAISTPAPMRRRRLAIGTIDGDATPRCRDSRPKLRGARCSYERNKQSDRAPDAAQHDRSRVTASVSVAVAPALTNSESARAKPLATGFAQN